MVAERASSRVASNPASDSTGGNAELHGAARPRARLGVPSRELRQSLRMSTG
ncbi:MAG: hypothetical protein AVDCRST_MAG89-134 [uncultured Gemmatimonadetes bacterium]|uniref:Uncharacterized protein n=1 Tax=uncultured Gemmatimonadota bacterium TaxID=203437 RepID=A0A6J4K4Y1_9BACT|nr:MAG: hypothetical protein AVDCRST_MAG89-134 [uncultured Gemmatimonadota bacterium]